MKVERKMNYKKITFTCECGEEIEIEDDYGSNAFEVAHGCGNEYEIDIKIEQTKLVRCEDMK